MSASAPPPPDAGAPAYNRETYLMEQFKAIAQRYEISDYFAQRLKQLEGFEIVLILDDSGSMNTPLQNQAGGPFAPSMTRWDELKGTVGIIVDIAAIMDKDGLDVYFLVNNNGQGPHAQTQMGRQEDHTMIRTSPHLSLSLPLFFSEPFHSPQCDLLLSVGCGLRSAAFGSDTDHTGITTCVVI